jgi:hypothetical protein
VRYFIVLVETLQVAEVKAYLAYAFVPVRTKSCSFSLLITVYLAASAQSSSLKNFPYLELSIGLCCWQMVHAPWQIDESALTSWS